MVCLLCGRLCLMASLVLMVVFSTCSAWITCPHSLPKLSPCHRDSLACGRRSTVGGGALVDLRWPGNSGLLQGRLGQGRTHRSFGCRMSTVADAGPGIQVGAMSDRAREYLEEEVKDLDTRLFDAPYSESSKIPTSVKVVDYAKLKAEGPRGGEAAVLCDAMMNHHYAVLRLDESEEQMVKNMWEAAARFTQAREEEKYEAAGSMRKAEGMVGVIGYGRMPDMNSFLEMRVNSKGAMVPSDIDNVVPGFTEQVLASREMFTRLAKDVISAAAVRARLRTDAVLRLLDDGIELPSGQISSTQHRICHYTTDSAIAFEAHTDTTFVTIIPRSSIPGLEIYDEQEKDWVKPEATAELSGASKSRYAIVMPGEYLQLVTGRLFHASVHRVTRSSAENPRTSIPLLLRGRMWENVCASALHDDSTGYKGASEQLQMMDGVSVGSLHRYLANPPTKRS